MKRLILTTVVALTATAAVVGAQGTGRRFGPRPMPGAGGPGAGPTEDPAEFLLSHTGELTLTDAQVTRLAAIARRSADRRRALRTQLDSMRPNFTPGERPDSAARARMRQRFEQMRPQMDRMREQSLADRRDAIAVLTPDQQAQAWDRVSRMGRGGGGRGMGRGFAGPRGGRMRGGVVGPRGGMRGQGFGPRGPMRRNDAGPQDDRGPARERPRPEDERTF
jgi:Spy/CpxP family protein refolding chaperone